MSKRRNGTNRVGSMLGLNPYGWGNGGKRKRPKGEKMEGNASEKEIKKEDG